MRVFFCSSATSWRVCSSMKSSFSVLRAFARCSFTILSISICRSGSNGWLAWMWMWEHQCSLFLHMYPYSNIKGLVSHMLSHDYNTSWHLLWRSGYSLGMPRMVSWLVNAWKCEVSKWYMAFGNQCYLECASITVTITSCYMADTWCNFSYQASSIYTRQKKYNFSWKSSDYIAMTMTINE